MASRGGGRGWTSRVRNPRFVPPTGLNGFTCCLSLLARNNDECTLERHRVARLPVRRGVVHAPRPRMLLGLTRWSGRNSAKLRVIGAMAAGAGPFARHAQVVRCEQRVSRAKGSAGGAFCRFDHVSSSVGSSQLRSKRAGRVVTPATTSATLTPRSRRMRSLTRSPESK